MKPGSEDGFRAKGLGWAMQGGPGDWAHRGVYRDGNRLQRHEQAPLLGRRRQEMSISLAVL